MAATFALALGCGGGDDDANVARGFGEVRVAAIDAFYNPGQPISTIEARFAAADPTRGCTTTTHGACRVIDCTGVDEPTLTSAGTLSVKTADERVQQEVEPGGTNAYSFGEPTLLFQDGDSLTIAASGADVPAFTIDVPFPPTLQAVEPLLTESENTLPLGHEEDTTVRVSGGSAGVELQVELRGTRATMRCTAPSEDGELVLSAEAIEAAGGGVVDIRGVTRATARAGKYDVALTLLSGVMQEERLLVLTSTN